MKRILIISVVLCGLLLSACKSSSIGIIGGADGPTSIFVASETENSVKKPIRMIKVDGKLYYDSGMVSDMVPRCGTLDGELKQVGNEYEIPKKNNQCNFAGAEGYQIVTSITREVQIDGKWVIFKLFDDPKYDMDIFKYCFYLNGLWENSEHKAELVVLTQDINYDIQDYFDLSKSYVAPDHGKYKTTFKNYKNYDKWGISLSAKDVTNKGVTILVEQFGGAPAGELQTGEAYTLEVSKNGEWEQIVTDRLINIAWHSIAYEIKKNDITELKVDWEWLYGELGSGHYRLKKEFTDLRAPGDFDKEQYELYFYIK